MSMVWKENDLDLTRALMALEPGVLDELITSGKALLREWGNTNWTYDQIMCEHRLYLSYMKKITSA